MSNMNELLQAVLDYESIREIEPLIMAKQAEIRQLQERVAAESARYKTFLANHPNGQQFVDAQRAIMAQFSGKAAPAGGAPATTAPDATAPAAAAAAPAQAPAPAPAAARSPGLPPRVAAPAPQVAPQAPAPQAVAPHAPAPQAPAPQAAAPAPRAAKPQTAPRAPAPKPPKASSSNARTAAATAAAAAKRHAIKAENPGYKATRSIANRMTLWGEGFAYGYQDYAQDPNAPNRYNKGDRSRGWIVGAEKAREDIEAGIIAPGASVTIPAVPAQASADYRAELIVKSPNAARDDIGSRPKLPAGVPAGEPILETADFVPPTVDEINAHFTTHEPPESEPAPHLDHWDERGDTDFAFSIDRVTEPPADVLSFLKNPGDDEPHDFLKRN